MIEHLQQLNDFTIIQTYEEFYSGAIATGVPIEVRYDYYHIPLFFYIIFVILTIWIFNRILNEILIRLRK